MTKQDIIAAAEDFVLHSTDNLLKYDDGLAEQYSGQRVYEPPIFAFGSPEDALFDKLKEPGVVGDHLLLPRDWLPEAKTVISFFLPFTEVVKKSNISSGWPSYEWLYGRVEGQRFINQLCAHLTKLLNEPGYQSVSPCIDERFWSQTGFVESATNADNPNSGGLSFTSNWSQRHAAFICGLGTFGLSKGLITKKGIAGRFGSIITELKLSSDNRDYTDIYEYCTRCGECIERCPSNAISMEKGKSHILCKQYLKEVRGKFPPRYGCGKCQAGVPCESRIP